MRNIIPVIMSGGSGTRLWPMSTEDRPKQFHALAGVNTMIQDTALRLSGPGFLDPVVICNARHGELADRQLAAAGVNPARIVLEPIGRNTAATAALGAATVRELDPEALMLLAPADHIVADVAAFRAALARAAPFAGDRIVTLGIEPTAPDTGFGYIERGQELGEAVFEIARFREKPNRETAEGYLRAGGFSWNAGMFLAAPDLVLQEFEESAEIRDGALKALAAGRRNGVFITLDAALFAATPSAPFDIAVMERTRRSAVAPCDIGWADVGSWPELHRLAASDAQGNASHGRVLTLDVRNTLVRGEGPLVALAGVEDLIVVATPDVVLIVHRDRAQEVKTLCELAKKA